MNNSSSEKKDFGNIVWKKSHCQMCFNACPIEVKVKNGKAVKIQGDSDDKYTMGSLCTRGLSGLTKLYDPHRVKKPLKRTNPEKGVGVDPGWEEIEWDEAFEVIGAKLKKIRKENPNKLICSLWPWEKYIQTFGWGTAFGTKNGGFSFSGVSNQCANPNHFIGMLSHGALVEFPDLDYCKYLIVLGAEYGMGSYQLFVRTAKALAEARSKGLKFVVVDPRLSVGAGRADEWLPIKPGTDLAFLLAMIYLILHEYGGYDEKFIKEQTNGPYLIGENGELIIDSDSGKPMVWDKDQDRAKVYDEKEINDFALTGEYVFNGDKCFPAFEYLVSETKEYTPEWASKITDIPADQIRRITREFLEAANVGGTITIDGKEYRHRPAVLLSYRGLQAHTNGGIAMMAQAIINMLVGALGSPGGMLAKSMDKRRFGGSPQLLSKGKDGIVRPHATGWEFKTSFAYPPERLDLREYCPLAFDLGHIVPLTTLQPEKYGFNYKPEALVIYHSNPLTNCGDIDIMTGALKKLDMVVTINIYLDESTDFADFVLPEHSYLERYNLSNFSFDLEGLQISQPVVKPIYDTMDGLDILIELAEKGGFLYGEDGFNAQLNNTLGLQKPYALELDKKYYYEQILDIQAKCHSEGKKDLEWYKKHGNDFQPVKPEYKYRAYRDARLPIYFNSIRETGNELKENIKKYDIEKKFGMKLNFAQYKGIPYWEESPIHRKDDKYDLYLIAYKSYLTTYADSATNPMIMDIAENDPYHLKIMINSETAKKKGLKSGDEVWVESTISKSKGRVKVTEGIHPGTLAISQGFGRWTNHPIAKNKGVKYNPHLQISLTYSGMLGGSMETSARVKIYKVDAGEKDEIRYDN